MFGLSLNQAEAMAATGAKADITLKPQNIPQLILNAIALGLKNASRGPICLQSREGRIEFA